MLRIAPNPDAAYEICTVFAPNCGSQNQNQEASAYLPSILGSKPFEGRETTARHISGSSSSSSHQSSFYSSSSFGGSSSSNQQSSYSARTSGGSTGTSQRQSEIGVNGRDGRFNTSRESSVHFLRPERIVASGARNSTRVSAAANGRGNFRQVVRRNPEEEEDYEELTEDEYGIGTNDDDDQIPEEEDDDVSPVQPTEISGVGPDLTTAFPSPDDSLVSYFS